jgi:uncharacterized protein YhfF
MSCTIIEITHVELTNYNKITTEYAGIEGEGGQSLEYWKKAHCAQHLFSLLDKTRWSNNQLMLLLHIPISEGLEKVFLSSHCCVDSH